MCFDHDAHPPELPADLRRIAGAAPGERVTVTSEDGTEVGAYLSVPPESGHAGVVILPDVRGLYPFYEELAERFAAAGHPAVVLDYFGRTAGTGVRDDDFEFWPHVEQTRIDTVHQDLIAARDALLTATGGPRPVAAVGFCFGGTQAFFAATNQRLNLAGAVGFYGGLSGRRFGVKPADRAEKTTCPLLGLFGGADESIPQSDIDEYDAALTAAGRAHTFHVYPGAPHSFFDRKQEQFAAESEDAWRRTLTFLAGIGRA
jgi:carboxymethylenebutenolidase